MEKQSYRFLYSLISELNGHLNSGDLFHLEELCEDFDIDYEDVFEYVSRIGFKFHEIDINFLISIVFEKVLTNNDISLDLIESSKSEYNITYYLNSIDSHLYINDDEIHDITELRDFIQNNPNILGVEEDE